MQVSKRKVNPTLEKQLARTLYQLVVDLKNSQEAEDVMKSLLSQTELTTVAKRLAVAYWLTKGRSYENIKENLKVSSATVADVQQRIKSPGWKLVIRKITAEEWASIWEEKIKRLIRK